MKIIIKNTEEEFNNAAADEVIRQLEINPSSVLSFATGKTPLGFYNELIERNKLKQVDFSKARFLSLDEYFGVNIDSQGTTSTCLEKNLYSMLNLDRKNIFKFNSTAPSAEEEALRYDKLISDLGGIDLILLGIGQNGHLGFNEPGAKFDSTTNLRLLTLQTKESNNRFAKNEKHTDYGITMGLKTIMNSGKVVLLAKGKSKTDIIYKTVYGHITEDVPSSILQLHPYLTVILDKDAAEKINLNE